MININSFKQLPPQVQIVAVVGLISTVVNLYRASKDSNKYRHHHLAMAISAIVVSSLAAYNENCMIRGDCKIYAYILAVGFAISQLYQLMSPPVVNTKFIQIHHNRKRKHNKK